MMRDKVKGPPLLSSSSHGYEGCSLLVKVMERRESFRRSQAINTTLKPKTSVEVQVVVMNTEAETELASQMSGLLSAVTATEGEEPEVVDTVYYDKSKSFFDKISYESDRVKYDRKGYVPRQNTRSPGQGNGWQPNNAHPAFDPNVNWRRPANFGGRGQENHRQVVGAAGGLRQGWDNGYRTGGYNGPDGGEFNRSMIGRNSFRSGGRREQVNFRENGSNARRGGERQGNWY